MVTENNFFLTRSRMVIAVVYTVLFLLITLFVLHENDEQQPLAEILRPEYLIPSMFYSAFSLWVSLGLFLFLRKFVHKWIAFPLSIIVGIPAGLILLAGMLKILFN